MFSKIFSSKFFENVLKYYQITIWSILLNLLLNVLIIICCYEFIGSLSIRSGAILAITTTVVFTVANFLINKSHLNHLKYTYPTLRNYEKNLLKDLCNKPYIDIDENDLIDVEVLIEQGFSFIKILTETINKGYYDEKTIYRCIVTNKKLLKQIIG